MSLIYKYSVCEEGCNSLRLSDLTGAFDATTNPGGFWTASGTNPSVANVAICSIDIIFPDGHTVTKNILDLVIPFPNTNSGLEKILLYSDLGLFLGASLPNGIYKTKITVSGTNTHNGSVPFSTSASRDLFIDCKAWCCVAKMFVKAAQEKLAGKSSCNDTLKIAKSLANLLFGAENSFDCGDYNSAMVTLQQVEAACIKSGCLTC